MVVKPVFQFKSRGCFGFSFFAVWCFKRNPTEQPHVKCFNSDSKRSILFLLKMLLSNTSCFVKFSTIWGREFKKASAHALPGTRVAQGGGGKVYVYPARDLSQLSGEQRLHGAVCSAWVRPHRLALGIALNIPREGIHFAMWKWLL